MGPAHQDVSLSPIGATCQDKVRQRRQCLPAGAAASREPPESNEQAASTPYASGWSVRLGKKRTGWRRRCSRIFSPAPLRCCLSLLAPHRNQEAILSLTDRRIISSYSLFLPCLSERWEEKVPRPRRRFVFPTSHSEPFLTRTHPFTHHLYVGLSLTPLSSLDPALSDRGAGAAGRACGEADADVRKDGRRQGSRTHSPPTAHHTESLFSTSRATVHTLTAAPPLASPRLASPRLPDRPLT